MKTIPIYTMLLQKIIFFKTFYFKTFIISLCSEIIEVKVDVGSDRIESNKNELNRTNSNLIFCHREFFDYFCIFFAVKSSVRIDQMNIIHHLNHLNASYSVHSEVRFDRTD